MKRSSQKTECSECVQVVPVVPVTLASEMYRHLVHGPLDGQGTETN